MKGQGTDVRRAAWLVATGLFVLTGCGSFQVASPPPLVYARYPSSAHNDFGVAYETEGDPVRAQRQYRKAVEKDPANYVAWANLGNTHARFQERERARAAYERSLALAPGYGPAVNNLAMCYLDPREPRPDLAITIIEAHLPLVEEPYRAAVEATLAEARAARAAAP
jgi:Tfp pilus assembly protein PilF